MYAVCALAALPDWPALVTRYNLSPARAQRDYAYLGSLLPHNLTTWYALQPSLDGVPLGSDYRRTLTEAPEGWRDWDLAEARRHARATEIDAALAAHRARGPEGAGTPTLQR